MDVTKEEDFRRMLGLAVTILKDMPTWLQPVSDMEDMRKILAGETTSRDGLIICGAIATALAFRTQRAIEHPLGPNVTGINNRLTEMVALFRLVQRCDAETFAVQYYEACDRIARDRVRQNQKEI